MPPSPSALCALVVDDDEDARELSRQLVKKAEPSAIVIAVPGAREAMDYLLRATNPADGSTLLPAVMLLDLNMPGMNGFDLLRWVHRNQSLSSVKVVMLSTSDSPAEIRKASELGAYAFFIKYPNPACFAAVFKQATGTATPFAANIDGHDSDLPVGSGSGLLRRQSSGNY
ncbi:MAG TPA: response regulator [Opitutaceae bacterium]|nr:response regulator [Opitutaceae bacterium]